MSSDDLPESDRLRIAARLKREQLVRFHGIAKNAYIAAGVNSTTWSRAINGQTMKNRSRIRIVEKLWPETHGDWTEIPDLGPAPAKLPRGDAEWLRDVVEEAALDEETKRRVLLVLEGHDVDPDPPSPPLAETS